MAGQIEAQRARDSDTTEILDHQSTQIEKLEANCNLFYELVIGRLGAHPCMENQHTP
jgi:hypothetical protein